MTASHREDPPEHGLPVAGDTPPSASDTDFPQPDRERSVIEMMNGPGRPDERTRKTVLWMALAFVAAMLALTAGVIYANGFDPLAIVALVVFCAVIYGLIGALRYKGVDPMEQFDRPRAPKRRRFRRRR
ncbi:MAG: hypothetical protein JJE27_02535 [Thermoleophilia bacterium]|nr:hypothetical protein [Thermoleophilia bacterium]